MLLNDASGAPLEDAESAAPGFEDYLSEIEDSEDQEAPEATPTHEDHESASDPEDVEAATEPAESGEDTESAETDEETEEADEAPVELTYDPSALVRVKVDGVEQQVTLDEALKGYSRTADYTRKTQAHAEAVRAFENERQVVTGERQMYAARLAQLEQAITDATPQEPDWDKVQQETPDQFPMLRAQWSLHKERLGALQAERQRAQEAVLRDQQAAQQQYLQAEQEKLLEALPEWKDAEKSKAARADMVAYVKHMGYTTEDIGRITDHRLIVLINKAMQYDKAQARKPKITERIEKVKVAVPGARKVAPKVNKAQQALQRLAKSGGSREAGEAAFEAYLEATDG